MLAKRMSRRESLLINRPASNGVHGIWGHGPGDLHRERIVPPKDAKGVWQIW
jgi:hypothetical protein